MKSLEQIFEKSPDLLNKAEVKELISIVQESHKIQFNQLQKEREANFKILELCMHSELVLIEGESCKDVVKKIIEII